MTMCAGMQRERERETDENRRIRKGGEERDRGKVADRSEANQWGEKHKEENPLQTVSTGYQI